MLFAQLTPTRDSTSELLDALRHREVAVFGHSTPGQTRTPYEGNGTPKRNIFFGKSLIVEQQKEGPQKEQHSTSSTSQTPSACLLYTSPSPRDRQKSRMPSSA